MLPNDGSWTIVDCGDAYIKPDNNYDKEVWPPTTVAPWWWLMLPTQKRNHEHEGKTLCAPTTIAPPFCMHKMRPWIKGKIIMGTCHSMITTPQW